MQPRKHNTRPSAMELEADKLLRAAGCEEFTTDAIARQSRVWRKHNDQYRPELHEAHECDPTPACDLLDEMSRREVMRIAERARLTERQYKAVELWTCGLTLRQSAERMGCAYKTVGNNLQAAFTAMQPAAESHPYLGLSDVIRQILKPLESNWPEDLKRASDAKTAYNGC